MCEVNLIEHLYSEGDLGKNMPYNKNKLVKRNIVLNIGSNVNMAQKLKPQQFQVRMEVKSHFAPKKGMICEVTNHEDCDWESIIKNGLENMYQELHVHGKPTVHKNIIDFKVSLTNRSNVSPFDVESKIDKFIGMDRQLLVESLSVE